MSKQKVKSTGALLQHWIEEIEEAPIDTLKRLRYCFPELEDKDLLPMALKHPEVKRLVRYCRARAAYYRRRERRTTEAYGNPRLEAVPDGTQHV